MVGPFDHSRHSSSGCGGPSLDARRRSAGARQHEAQAFPERDRNEVVERSVCRREERHRVGKQVAYGECTRSLRLCPLHGEDRDDARVDIVADVIADRLLNPEDSGIEQRCRERVAALCARFPLYSQQRQLQNV